MESPRPGASEQSEAAPGRARRKKIGGPRQSPRSVCLPPARSSNFMFSRMGGASAGFCGRGAIRGKAQGPAVGAKRRLPGPGKTKATSAGGPRLSPRSGRQARPGGVEGAPEGRTGAGENRPTVRPRNAAPAGDCNREGGRGNTGVAAVHKAGEERRFGATPATATPLPSSWKARDPVRPSKARPLRVRARTKKTGGPRQSQRSVCLPWSGAQIHV